MKRGRLGRLLWLAAAIVVLGGGLYLGFREQPLEVDGVAVELGTLQESFVQEGKTRVLDRYVVAAPVDGLVSRIELDAGAELDAQQAVTRIAPLPAPGLDARTRATTRARLAVAEAGVDRAQAIVEGARAEAERARAEARRVAELHESQSVPLEDLERAQARSAQRQSELHSAQFAVDVARHEVEVARAQLEYFGVEDTTEEPYPAVAVRSPVAGRLLAVLHESEGVVRAGEPLFEVGDPRSLEVEVDVLSADAVRLAVGTPVELERWGGDAPLAARVKRVEPSGFTEVSALGVEEQRVLAICDITSEPATWSKLGDGYRVEARFILWEGDDVLSVPSSALFRHEDGWAAFVLDEEARRVTLRDVEPGHRAGLHVEVLSGLREGEVVVPHPPRELRPGARVELRAAARE